MSALTLQNVVGGGDLGVEIDLYSIADAEFENFDIQYEPELFPGIAFLFDDLNPTIIISRSREYYVFSSNYISKKEGFNIFFTEMYDKSGLEFQRDLELRYFVTTGELGRTIDLPATAIALGFTKQSMSLNNFLVLDFSIDQKIRIGS